MGRPQAPQHGTPGPSCGVRTPVGRDSGVGIGGATRLPLPAVQETLAIVASGGNRASGGVSAWGAGVHSGSGLQRGESTGSRIVLRATRASSDAGSSQRGRLPGLMTRTTFEAPPEQDKGHPIEPAGDLPAVSGLAVRGDPEPGELPPHLRVGRPDRGHRLLPVPADHRLLLSPARAGGAPSPFAWARRGRRRHRRRQGVSS